MTEATLKKCRRCKDLLPTQLFPLMRLGKHSVGSTCTDCSKKKPWKKTDTQKAREGKIQKTIPSEKLKAYARDGKCIITGCPVFTFAMLDFHHVYHHSGERKYDETRNLAENGVMLCREHHRKLTDGDKELDEFCKKYINNIYI